MSEHQPPDVMDFTEVDLANLNFLLRIGYQLILTTSDLHGKSSLTRPDYFVRSVAYFLLAIPPFILGASYQKILDILEELKKP